MFKLRLSSFCTRKVKTPFQPNNCPKNIALFHRYIEPCCQIEPQTSVERKWQQFFFTFCKLEFYKACCCSHETALNSFLFVWRRSCTTLLWWWSLQKNDFIIIIVSEIKDHFIKHYFRLCSDVTNFFPWKIKKLDFLEKLRKHSWKNTIFRKYPIRLYIKTGF